MDRNQLMETFPIWKITDPYIIGQNDNFVSINSCLTVDITGQVGSEALGFNQFSGTGGNWTLSGVQACLRAVCPS